MPKTVERNEDMSPDLKLRLHRQNDGDIQVIIISEDGRYRKVEFCTSGGRSLHTMRALNDLMSAMEKDNIESPIP